MGVTASATSATRDRLLDAAEAVVIEAGAVSLTLEAVAVRAGVSKGGLLYHFPSKDRLIESLVERTVQRADEALEAAAAAGGRGAFTRAYLDITVPTSPRRPASDRLTAALVGAVGIDPALLEPLRAAYRRWQHRLEHDGLDPAVATVVRMAVDGWWTAAVLGLPPLSPRVHREARALLADLADGRTARRAR